MISLLPFLTHAHRYTILYSDLSHIFIEHIPITLVALCHAKITQVEIDEFRDYDKALGALREALRQLASSTSAAAPELRRGLERKVRLVEQFIHARDIEKDDPNKMVDICEVCFNLHIRPI